MLSFAGRPISLSNRAPRRLSKALPARALTHTGSGVTAQLDSESGRKLEAAATTSSM